MTPLRVMHLSHVINRYDFIDTIVRHLDRKRFEVYAATFRPSTILEPDYAEIGIPHITLPVPTIKSYPAYVRASRALARFIQAKKIAILHAHHFWEGMTAALAKRWYPHFRLVLHRHYAYDILNLPLLKRRLLVMVEAWTYKQADSLVVPTKTVAEVAKRTHTYLPPLQIIPYGFALDEEKYQLPPEADRRALRLELGAAPEDFVLINVALHRWQKGQHVLLKAFADFCREVSEAKLWLVGDGPERAKFEALAQQLGLLAQKKCLFLGFRKGLQVRDLIAAADVFVHPTFSEAFPQVMIESLALEKPLIITQVSGAVDYLTHAREAWLIPPQDQSALREALLTLYQQPALRKSLGKAGAKLVRSRFHYKQVNPFYESLYEQLSA